MVDRARRWLSTGTRNSIGHVYACTVNEKAARKEHERKKHEKGESTNARAPGDTRRSSWRSAQLKRRRAATARLLPPAAALRAYNEANRATALARGCSPRFGPIRRRSPLSASNPRYFLAVFEELRPPARTSRSTHRDVTPTRGFYRVARTKLSADPEPGKRSRRIYALAQPVQEIASYFDSLIPLNVGIVELALSWNRPAVAFNPNTRGLKRAKGETDGKGRTKQRIRQDDDGTAAGRGCSVEEAGTTEPPTFPTVGPTGDENQRLALYLIELLEVFFN
ncbi:hypothetical protein WN51_02842 [Melipona quadrifasciata]|uniref:Uncharacterized protein n=1 Tax=Melipona quadrifasciata TaxID=166423 RepID=A0A0M9AA30_9HYME|nr:hypothetical protein WN51_02842 [Melipona quadrifasciata]